MTSKQFEVFQESFEAITNNDEFKGMIEKYFIYCLMVNIGKELIINKLRSLLKQMSI